MLLLRYLHGRPLFSGTRILNNVLRGCTRNVSETIARNNEKKQDQFKSQLFPDYEIVYALPAIRYVSLFNFAKTISTACVGLGSITVGGLYATSYIEPHLAINAFAAIALGSAYFHLGGFMFSNNFVGSIYMKDEDETAIISYVNYWGKRSNLMVEVANIVPIDEDRPNLLKMVYRKLRVVTSKKRFRIYLGKKGIIIKEDKLQAIIGHWR